MSPTNENIVDGVLRYPSTGLKVLVVGGGPGGLLTALECWRKGHQVQVLEKNTANSPSGDTFVIGPSALASLKHYPTMLQEYLGCSWDSYSTFRRTDGQLVAPPSEFEWNRPGVPEHAAYPLRIRSLVSRAGLSTILYNQCRRLGIPVTFGVSIVDYTENDVERTATAIDEQGQRYTSDIVVAADGLGTKSHKAIFGQTIRAIPTGYAISRVMYSADGLKDSPYLEKETEELRKLGRADLRLYTGHDFHFLILISEDYVSVYLTTLDDGTAEESWSAGITASDVLAKLPNSESWEPLVIEAFRNVPENKIVKWKLCWRDPQTKWTSPGGRIIQVGDSAHAFIPSSIAGATTALEDAQSLAECLRLAGKDNASLGTRIHEFLRYQRVSLLQRTGFANRQEMHREGGMEDVVKENKPHGPLSIGKWVWTHNPEKYAAENFVKAQAHLETGAHFDHTNLPIGFKWAPWSMQEEIEKQEKGIVTDLKSNGDWSTY
ncbi:hypothetical protein F4805DRAFT_475330 [Annulohypoxylon moriforme]|nr:hypothetical protein F4805DRAFT_475330 [Annulohypoxylon moriforme]